MGLRNWRWVTAVIIEGEGVLEWHKTPTTPDIQGGVEVAIEEVLRKAKLPGNQIESVKIGTTVSIPGERPWPYVAYSSTYLC